MPVTPSQSSLRSEFGSSTRSSANNLASRDWLWVLSFTLFGAWLRLWQLGSKSLWLDEGASFALARMPWKHFTWVWWQREANMTAYYLLLRPWLHLGTSEAWLRLPSAIFGIVSIPLIYVLARRLLNARAALFSAALLAVNPAHVYYSQEARSYSLTVFLLLLSSLFFVRALQNHRVSDLVGWITFSILAVYSHYFAALVLVSQVASVLFLRPKQLPWKRLIAGSASIAALAAPGIAFVVIRGSTLDLPWMPKPSGKELVHLWMFLGGSGPKFALESVLWLAGYVAIARTFRTWGRSAGSWRAALILSWALLPIVITVLVSLHRSVFNQRYLLVCLPATAMLAALGADWLKFARVGIVLVAALCVMSTIAVVRSHHTPREDWRGATNGILDSAQPGDAVVFYPFYARNMFDYYRERDRQNLASIHVFAPVFYGGGEYDDDLLRALNSDPQQFRHVWVVLYGHSATPDDLGQHSSALLAILLNTFGQPAVRQFAEITVLEFGK